MALVKDVLKRRPKPMLRRSIGPKTIEGKQFPPIFLSLLSDNRNLPGAAFFKVQSGAHGTTKLVRGESCLLTTTASSCCSAFFNGLKCSSIGDDGTQSHHILERPREVCSLETAAAAASLMKCVCVCILYGILT